jgi:Protein of unknown function (DUF1064)
MASHGWDHVSEADIARMNRSRTTVPTPITACPVSKPAKYRNTKTEMFGIVFDSKKEADYFLYLRSLEQAGEITQLRRQYKWEIAVQGRHIAWWLSDFDYTVPSRFGGADVHVVIDVKSPITRKNPTYRIKRKLVEALYGFEITEI